MESIVLAQKSVADIKDPIIAGLVGDVTTILRAELLQSLSVAQSTGAATKSALSKHFAPATEAAKQLEKEDRDRLKKMTRNLNDAAFKNQALRLGISLRKDQLASEQVDYEKIFGYLKGKEAQINNSLDAIGKQIVVPFSMFPDPETQELVEKIKSADKKEGALYADYLHLLDKEKLIELYERTIGSIENRSEFFASHQPDAEELTKIKRTVGVWQRAPSGAEPRYRNRYLRLVTTRVRCADETEHEGAWPFEGEGIANDRIDLTAISLAPNGSSTIFGPQMVSDNFEDNREFSWVRQLAIFDLNSYPRYPATFGSAVTIAEIDYGAGFANTVREIYNGIKGAIVEIVSKIGEMLGNLYGVGEVGKFIGKALGELIVLGLGELISIIGRAVQDDVFVPQIASVRLDSPYSTFFGVLDKWPGPFRSPEQELVYNGFGGSYRVYCIWELIREQEG